MSKLPPNQMNARKVASLKNEVYGDSGNLWITVRDDNWAYAQDLFFEIEDEVRCDMDCGHECVSAAVISCCTNPQALRTTRLFCQGGEDPVGEIQAAPPDKESCADHTLSERLSTEDRCGSRKRSRSEHAGHPHAEPHAAEEETA